MLCFLAELKFSQTSALSGELKVSQVFSEARQGSSEVQSVLQSGRVFLFFSLSVMDEFLKSEHWNIVC